ncbi:hypothetical protein [Kitasatospora sp. MAA4]|uniref:hypothetical protein n=1 Tax=Kitasatospora sp. MAA4 TaxID=3035093 RepID=UPI002473D5AC|nr:hypothetical protein [Kitasatospora sp. MAA4]
MANRLVAVKWTDPEGAYAHDWSRVLLMREYLRRAALWAEAYRIEDEWPFFDLAARIDPSVRADPALVAWMEEALDGRVGLPIAYDSCFRALHWAALLDAGLEQLPALDDPFEPLIMLFERGGGFGTENRSADFSLAMVRFKTWDQHLNPEPIVALDHDVLDELDPQGWERSGVARSEG